MRNHHRWMWMWMWLLGACGDDGQAGQGPGRLDGDVSPYPVSDAAALDAAASPGVDAGADSADARAQRTDAAAGRADAGDASGRGPMGVNDAGIPGQRGPTGRVRGWVCDPEGEPILNASISAGGVPTSSGQLGLFLLDEVPAGDAVGVTARALRRTRGHARVRVTENATADAIIVMSRARETVLSDVAEDSTVETEEGLSLTLPAGALSTIWGNPAQGPVTLSYAVALGHPEIASVPDMSALVETETRQTVSYGAVEWRLSQDGSPLSLEDKAEVVIPLSGIDSSTSTPLQLFRFDEELGLWRPHGMARVQEGSAVAEVSHLGWISVGELLERSGCARGDVSDANGDPVPGMAFKYWSATFLSSFSASGDANGEYCLNGAQGGYRLLGFGVNHAGYAVLQSAVSLSGNASAGCAEDVCEDMGTLPATAMKANCASGEIAALSASALRWRAVDEEGETVGEGSLPKEGGAFCVDIAGAVTLSITAGGVECGEPLQVKASNSFCGDGSCTDLGTITCCDRVDRCGDSLDNDCDGVVDQACTCGSHSCDSDMRGRCCTAQDTCGARPEGEDACVEVAQAGDVDEQCPDEQEADAPFTYSGCCRPDGRCGLHRYVWPFGCIAREDAHLATALGPLQGISCTTGS